MIHWYKLPDLQSGGFCFINMKKKLLITIVSFLFSIVGIIGENSIFTFLQFKENLKVQSVDESVEYAISTRLRPKLMTALGTIIALMPLALGIGTRAKLHQPLAIAVIGGF